MRYSFVAAAALAALLVSFPLAAQGVAGRVVDADSGDPIVAATVELVGVGLVTLTDSDGRFGFHDRVDTDRDSLVVRRLDYLTAGFEVVFDNAGELTIELERAPIELEGVSTDLGFGARMELLGDRLDERIGEWPGTARVADAADLRPFDDEWEGDPYKFLHYGPLKVSWQANEDPMRQEDEVWIRGFGRTSPEVWLDDRQVWLRILIETPNEALCRVETYVPPEKPIFADKGIRKPGPPSMIRAYTCSFMARAATGQEEVCPVIQWGRLISGPEVGTNSLLANDRRGAVRPPGSVTPIDLGPGLDLTALASNVRSGTACR